MAARTRGSSGCCPHIHVLACLSMLSCIAALAIEDTLRQGGSVRDGQTLVSASGDFELGFFNPSGVSSNRYVGIWYKKTSVPEPTDVVWVANRERPLTDTSGVLTIDGRGSLVILDGKGRPVEVLTPGSAANTSMATLLDSGNFLFIVSPGSSDRRSSPVVLWQSFDHPTNTWLPGMRLGKKGEHNRQLTSWKSPSDPSPGDFAFGADPDGPRVFVSRGAAVTWSSGIWNGQFFNNLSDLWYVFNSMGGRLAYSDEPKTGEAYFEYKAGEAARLVMEPGGQVRLWTCLSDSWVVLWAAPVRRKCETPGYCGANGLCNRAATPTCKCLDGFETYAPARWASGDWTGGCLRLSPLTCGDGDRFLRLRGVKLPPAFSSNYRGGDRLRDGSCKAQCLARCRCTAYAPDPLSSTGCVLWFGQLLGLQEAVAESDDWAWRDIYVRLAAADPVQTSEGMKRLLFVALPITFVINLTGVSLYCFLRTKHKGQQDTGDQELLLRDIGMDRATTYNFVDVNEGGGERSSEICLYSFSDVLIATNNFSDDNKLGEGGFGPVYKGKLPDEREIAVKRLSTQSGQGLEEFKTEILLIARLQHKNLVKLLGCCIQRGERLLIYEYLPNKSLDFFLFDPSRATQLNWNRRFQIIEGLAQGLLYLHKYSRLTIIHRDLKASNVLLDDEMNPKISDFGMARIFSSNEPQANTHRIVGTFGYMSPEYAMEGLFSIKSDVFSFGVVLLEILSGKKNIGSHLHFPGPRSLLGHAWGLWKAGRELELMDPALGGLWIGREVSRCIYVGLMCVQECAMDRPTMSEVVAMLSSDSSTNQEPKLPAFLSDRHTQENISVEFGGAVSSTNNVTISVIEGR